MTSTELKTQKLNTMRRLSSIARLPRILFTILIFCRVVVHSIAAPNLKSLPSWRYVPFVRFASRLSDDSPLHFLPRLNELCWLCPRVDAFVADPIAFLIRSLFDLI